MENKERNTFFNVMPEIKGTSPMVNSAPVPTTAPASSPQVTTPSGVSKRTIWIITGSLVMLTLVVVVVWFVFFNKPKESPPAVVAPKEQAAPETPEVTTSSEWLLKFFDSETCTEIGRCGDESDPDRDGLKNKVEFERSTDPNNSDSDMDGIADGDEVNVFGSEPLQTQTYKGVPFNDADFVKGGYNFTNDVRYSPEELADIKSKIREFGLHQPTITTIGDVALKLYEFIDETAPKLPDNLDQSQGAKQTRDALRMETIKKVGAALLAYKEKQRSFPRAKDFVSMVEMIKEYNNVATTYNDPIGLERFVYGYQASEDGLDFTLTYYSETLNQLIKYKPADAVSDSAKDDSPLVDLQRKVDLEKIKDALLLYSSGQIDPKSPVSYVFPTKERYTTELARFLTSIPKDPVTKEDYEYQVGPNFDTFTLRAKLQRPPAGTTGYLCNQLECREY